MNRSLARLKILQGHFVNGQDQETQSEGPTAVVQLEIKEDIRTALLTINSPKTLNALSEQIWSELNAHLLNLEKDDRINSVVVTGVGKAFSAGADLNQMKTNKFPNVYFNDYFERDWYKILPSFRKPIIAAVNGYCFGGGLELALMCDVILASENAKFGLPEIKLGLFPGAGGTQRIIRQVGKSKAMEMILSGEMIDAQEALHFKLASSVLPPDQLLEAALKLAKKIGKLSKVAVAAAKMAVNYSAEAGLSEGMRYESSMFNSLTGTKDAKIGVEAFLSKQKAKFVHS
ncbi:unnamed protein product [Moneuplotes crassus]|uniref:Enoyl-CoA hydratase n=1 Tax=Euplotes crassus TaxID=5936 RepID=A0A7S3KUM6_EUPCR|nr:unnamed protein product [Moneuplotes crassus]|mmetsp:Transcript_8805/g.8354  ORF Transcript_8805/g.8354 Transcript_8805/m.8354 type:complete len:288 (+) Transcript_8805:17-880(+)